MAIIIVVTDFPTLLISSIGIALSVCYFFYQALKPYHTKNDVNKEQESIVEWLREGDDGKKLKLLLADYASGNEEVRRRDNVTLLVGTILITSSFVILGNITLKQDLPIGIFSLASIGLFTIWLLALHETGKKINKITYDHLKSIEEALTQHFAGENGAQKYSFGTHRYVCDKTLDQSVWWLRGRRMFWAFVLFLLSVAWMMLSIKIY